MHYIQGDSVGKNLYFWMWLYRSLWEKQCNKLFSSQCITCRVIQEKKSIFWNVIVSIPKNFSHNKQYRTFFSQWPIRSPPNIWTFPPKQPYKRLNFVRCHTNIRRSSAFNLIYFTLLAAKILRIFWEMFVPLPLLLLSVGHPVDNAPDVLQPCDLLYYPWCSNSHHQSSSQEILAVRDGAKPYSF